MAMNWQSRHGRARQVRPWWRPLAISAAATAAIAMLLTPLPAAAAPNIPAAPNVPMVPAAAVPDPGSRPIPLGTLVMPGQPATSPTTSTPIVSTGLVMSPLVAKREKMQAEIATLGDSLIQLGQDRDLATQQQTTAATKVTAAQDVLTQAQREAENAAAESLRDAAALPPGTFGSSLQELDSLARMQRGDTATEQAASRHLSIAQGALTAAQAEQTAAAQLITDRSTKYTQLNTTIATKQAALQKFEQAHATELGQADLAESTQDQALGNQYLAGAPAGRGADRRAVAALTVALAQRGKPYEWSEEGPQTFDCSGLMWYSYHQSASGSFPLARVSRDQYWQTHTKVVDRYSLLPGDLLFFSSSNSWTGIHHVAMYAGAGMMVEAPRTGLDVRLTPVRWTRLFQATRIYGSVDGATPGPDLNTPPPAGNGHPTTPPPTTRPPVKPPTHPNPPTKKPTPSKTPSPSDSPSPTTKPPTTPTTPAPTTTAPAESADPPSGGTPSGSSSDSSPSGSLSNSATAAASKSATASKSVVATASKSVVATAK
jgi:cell wall-associated NlpC family hydrolase